MNALVGYTGFVGSNIYLSGCFDSAYNSSNIAEAFGTSPDLLVFCGLRAEKYLANNFPNKDMELVVQAEDNISRINPKKLVLISTIDVFRKPNSVDENSQVDTSGLHPYGYNRYMLELWVREHYPDALIVRLPGLYGKNLKKNFIYDFINVVPFMLANDKYYELSNKAPILEAYYKRQENGFYKLCVSDTDKDMLKDVFRTLDFSALSFTDSRSRYQFYNLGRLWDDIQISLEEGIALWHPATEPVSAGELYRYLTDKDFVNELSGMPADYNYKTVYSEMFGGHDGYISNKEQVLEDIRSFCSDNV